MRVQLCAIVVLLSSFLHAQNNPVADPSAVVLAGNARFTVLTAQMIRMEWSAEKQFEDHASMVFLNRQLPVPKFTKSLQSGWLLIKTDKLTVKYKPSKTEFTPQNLSVTFELDGKPVTWTPGMKDVGNLLGTTRTLDGVEGATSLEPGLVSRNGWVVVDDSDRPLFDNSDWPWVMPRPKGQEQDLYFFGYGHDYKQALGDFTRVAGKIPLPPRFAFGTWWSRYWAYTDQEFKELVRDFRNHDVPLDVLVIDMDWHLTFDPRWWKSDEDQSGHRKGWTGYTWNKNLFPDPPAFLRWVHEQGLKTTVNLHPASGVQPYEAAYPEMARAMGIDPATKKYVPFDIASKKFTENYFKYLHDPLNKQGIDFFWLDWQQEDKTSLPGVNPTFWLNYVHTSEMERKGERPLIFHRWGGLGNHRYQIGFSGDTISVWKSLAFQPYFTATAANVCYAYWSHDIGGHMPGTVSPELYTRWIQFGLFSPILRTHTTKNPDAERRIWAYPPRYADIMRDAFQLRYALIPYIYSQARHTYDSGVAFLHPLYYDYPDAPEAYDFKDEYTFGDDMIVSPVVTEMDKNSRLATKSIWLPAGEWIEWSSGTHLQGPAKIDRTYALSEIPVFVRAGAVIPMAPKMSYSEEKPVDPLILTVMPGTSGETHVYADQGNSLGYKSNEFAWTTVKQTREGDTVRVYVSPVEGSYPGMPQERAYEFHLFGVFPPNHVSVNGQELVFTHDETEPGWHYDGNHTTVVITSPRFKVSEGVELTADLPHVTDAQQHALDGLPGHITRLRTAMDIMNGTWRQGWSPDSLVHAYQVGDRMTYFPDRAIAEVDQFQAQWPKMISDVLAMQREPIDKSAIVHALVHLGVDVQMMAAGQ
jgi:alpha-glucosidase (family GH31 glycosyl hydrolase)